MRKRFAVWMVTTVLLAAMAFPATAQDSISASSVIVLGQDIAELSAPESVQKETEAEPTSAIVEVQASDSTEAAETEEPILEPVEEETAASDEIAPEETEPVRSYSDEELSILAHVICGEAQTYSTEEQRLVGSVVLNRVAHQAYPNTIRGVVFQKGQYACTWDGNYYRTPTQANWDNARYLLENGSILPGNVVYQAGFRQGHGIYKKTNRHYYCYY